MKKLDSRQINVPKAEQRSLLSSNNDVMRGSALGVQDYIFNEITMHALRELGGVLLSIHNRLISEGHNIQENDLSNFHENSNINKN